MHAGDSATVHAWDSATVHAGDSATVRAWENVFVRLLSHFVSIKASASVVILAHAETKQVEGGRVIKAVKPKTAAGWCAHHMVRVDNGIATLFKAVGNDFISPHGISYAPGTTPVAPDWDGGKEECGGGLHFSPQPFMALSFNNDAKKFVACPVRLEDIVVHSSSAFPEKVKAKGCAAPVWECDIDGNAQGA